MKCSLECTGASFDTTFSAISIFPGIHSDHTAKVNSAEAIVYEKTIVSAFAAEFTWPIIDLHSFSCQILEFLLVVCRLEVSKNLRNDPTPCLPLSLHLPSLHSSILARGRSF